jgi:hypothetical protein
MLPEGWPAELANRFPSAPSEQLLTKALIAARLLVDRVISSDAEMCFIWDGAPDGGAALRNSVESHVQTWSDQKGPPTHTELSRV